jgi:hypothetical protein
MTSRFSAERWRTQVGRLRAAPAVPLALFFATILIIAYVVILANTPIAIRSANIHDDALYIDLARYLSEGRWLGPFNQYTLMKGPGYPFFLAASNRLGIPVSVAHALFHCAAIVFFVAVAARLLPSPWLAAILFPLLLWHPLSFTEPFPLVLRDSIYYGQVLIFLAALGYALLGARGKRNKLIWGAVTGVVLGWVWLTREEGVWLLPGVAVVAVAAIVRAYRAGSLRPTMATLAVVVGAFAATQAAFAGANWWAYGKFAGVDTKEANFQRALREIEGVEPGATRPFVPVARATRERIYAASPAFASLQNYFEGTAGAKWRDYTCQVQPAVCGEIGAGHFMWALRDAAASNGNYASPQAASAFFGRVADEISDACGRGILKCDPPLIAEMPHVTEQQLSKVPGLYTEAAKLLLLWGPLPAETQESSGIADIFDAHRNFLHAFLVKPSRDIPGGLILAGWYYRSGNTWFSPRVIRQDGTGAPAEFSRLESPDIARLFHDEQASAQRFRLVSHCEPECRVELLADDGSKTILQPSLLHDDVRLQLGPATIHFDKVINPPRPSRRAAVSAQVRAFVSGWYSVLLPPLFAAGLIAFAAATVLHFRSAFANGCYVMALALWVLIFARATLLMLITATSFPALLSLYLAPAYFLLVGAVVFSLGALVQLAGRASARAPSGIIDAPTTTG